MTEQEPGLLIAAVSGGIDSVVLLDILVQQNVPLVVAHVNHGIRPDSGEDEALVRRLAETYNVRFVSTQLGLTAEASEDTARHARYAWLNDIKRQYQAAAIATAHHEDDIFETIIINLSRGTGWRGLCSLRETADRRRPLLGWSKADIISYALEHRLEWRDDSTNESLRYLRNRIRHAVIPKLAPAERQALRRLYDSQVALRQEVAAESKRLCKAFCQDGELLRYPLIMSPDPASLELLRTWLGESLEQSRMRDLLLFAKVARGGAKWSLDRSRFVTATSQRLIVLAPRD